MLTPNHHRTHVNQLRYKNRLLGAFEPAILAQLEPHIKPVNLKHGATICEAGGTLEHAYFPEGGALSLLTVLENGSAIESGNIGREGAFGIFAVMSSRISFSRCVVQVEGPMVRCLLEPLSEAFQSSGQIR
jgi:CRP-like cAMP-binding protein